MYIHYNYICRLTFCISTNENYLVRDIATNKMEDYYHLYMEDKFLFHNEPLHFEIDFDESKKELVRVRQENVLDSFFQPYKMCLDYISDNQRRTEVSDFACK